MGEDTSASRRVRSVLSGMIAGALLVAGMTTLGAGPATAADPPQPPPLLQRDGNVVTSDPIPTVQIDNGYVWAQTTIGSTVYAVGRFNNARAPLAAPGTSLTARSNVLAYNITTGQLLPFAPQVNGVIKAVAASPDGSRIYVGGTFTSVNGQTRYNFAALDASTGQLVPGFAPSVGGTGVYALATSGSSVYVGGLFTQGNGTARKNLAAFNASTGALLPWGPQTDLQVDAMVMDPAGQNVIAAGRFSQVNGNTAMRGAVALNRTSGAVDTAWALPLTVKNGATTGKAGIFGLAADTTAVYGTGWVYANVATGNLEGAFAAEAGTGRVRWIADCLGDHYGVYSTGKVVYTTSHTHACGTMNMHPEQNPRTHRYAEAFTADVRGTLGRQPAAGGTYQNWQGTPAPSAYAWTPDWAVGVTTGLGQAGLSITGAGSMISVGGEFRSVNNGRFEGLVRFSTAPPGGAKDGPRLSGASWPATAVSNAPGRVRVSIPANWDRDDLTLTYELRRTGRSTPVATTTANGTWWSRPAVVLEDPAAGTGSQEYSVIARDGNGNAVTSQAVRVNVMPGGPTQPNPTVLAADEFARTSASGWGSAVTGGAWTIVGGAASAATVADGQGRMSLAASATRNATLDATPVGDALIETQFRVDQAPSTGGAYIGVIARSSGAGKYLVRAWLRPDGSVWLVAHREGTVLATQAVSGLTWTAGTSYSLKASVTGSSSVTLSARIWPTGAAEPGVWQLNATDTTPLAATGAVGLSGNRPGSATTTQVVAFDTFRVTAP